MTTLYLCYQSLCDPLTQTQVVAYLEGLARAGWRPILVTFEPKRLSATDIDHWERRLSDLGIRWRRLRYHKRPTVPATALDIASGVALGIWLIVRYRVRLIHARSHVPAVMAAVLSTLTNRPYLFDIRGFLAEEYADAGVWAADGFLFRWTKNMERVLVGRARGLVVLTGSAAVTLRRWYPRELSGKPMEVIPCCVDLRSRRDTHPEGAKAGVAAAPREKRLVYVGKLGGWYPTRSMVEFFATASRCITGLKWTVLTHSDTRELRDHITRLCLDSHVTIGRASPEELLTALDGCSAGLCLYRRDRSAAACSPTKVPEYLAAGLPVVASRGVGDIDQILGEPETGKPSATGAKPLGVLVDERDPRSLERAAEELRRLLDDPTIRGRCREAAKNGFDLETHGWPCYQRIYGRLTEHDRSDSTVAACASRQSKPAHDTEPFIFTADSFSRYSPWKLKNS